MNFQVTKTAPTVYLDQSGNAINGFRVTIYMPAFDETHMLNVASLDPSSVKDAGDKLYTQRKALADLSAPSEEG